MHRVLEVGTSIAASVATLGAGARVRSARARPEQMLTLYDFESCPFCRKAREALSILEGVVQDRRVVGIPSQDLIVGLGAVHCLTQQEPAEELAVSD